MGEQDPTEWDRTQFAVVEYAHLREEIIKLVELQFQLSALCVIALGTVLSIGYGSQNAAIILIHPLLSLILGITWLHHTFRIHRIAAYIRSGIEQKVGLDNLGWEHYVQCHPMPIGRSSYWGLRAVFVASSLLSIGASVTVATYDVSTVALLVLAVLSAIITTVMFYAWREPAPELLGPPAP